MKRRMQLRSGRNIRYKITVDQPDLAAPDSPDPAQESGESDDQPHVEQVDSDASSPDNTANESGSDDSDSSESESDDDPEPTPGSILAKLFEDEKINRSNEDYLEDLATDWTEGFEDEEEAEQYREKLESYVAYYNSVPTIGEIMKLQDIEDEDRRELIDMRLKLDMPDLERQEWQKVRNTLKMRVDYYAGRLDKDSPEAREVVGCGKNLGEAIRQATHITEDRRRKLLEMHRDLATMSHASEEAPKLEKRIRTALLLNDGVPPPRIENPLGVLQAFRAAVDQKLYGLTRPKEELLCFLNGHLTSNAPGCVVGLESQPGMGKTSLAIAMAEAMNCGWYKIPMGSLTEASQITGNQPVFTGSNPGLVVEALKKFSSGMGVLILDEVDKIPKDGRESRGLISVLLELLDFSQNNAFQETHLQMPLDLSKMVIIVTMNNRELVDPIVLNRIQTLIKIKPYEYNERLTILRDIMIPKYLDKYGLQDTVCFSQEAMHRLLDLAPKTDKGMRPPENALKTVLSRLKLYRTCFAGGDMSLVSFRLPDFSMERYTVTPDTVEATAGHLRDSMSISMLMMYQ